MFKEGQAYTTGGYILRVLGVRAGNRVQVKIIKSTYTDEIGSYVLIPKETLAQFTLLEMVNV